VKLALFAPALALGYHLWALPISEDPSTAFLASVLIVFGVWYILEWLAERVLEKIGRDSRRA